MNLTRSDIKMAETLPSSFYFDEALYEKSKESVFASHFQWLGKSQTLLPVGTNVHPVIFLPGFIDEPLLLTQSPENQISCMSNVCTHRAFILVHNPGESRKIICKYHGRKFSLSGQMEHMPEFKEAENFPRPCDHLAHFPAVEWEGFVFVSLHNTLDFSIISNRLNERLYFLPISKFVYAPQYDKVYNVKAHWALYCDNFLEGFHIPFVHDLLGSMIDYGSYTTECYELVNLQIGYTSKGTPCFDLPEGHPDFGKEVSAYYYWIFPNTMLNVYPWGLQVNVIQPQDSGFTKVLFYHYIYDEKLWQRMRAEEVAEKTEREDEWVVEGVQKGLKSRAYSTGRFSPTREQGVHHFHQLLREKLSLQ